MSKHVLDRPRTGSEARAGRFLGIEREVMPNSASTFLWRRTREGEPPRRFHTYVGLARKLTESLESD